MKEWFKKLFIAMIEARQAEANRRIAMMQLSQMSERELNDIGIGRGDIRRVVYEEDENYNKKTSSQKKNVSWWEHLNRKFCGKLHKTNHA